MRPLAACLLATALIVGLAAANPSVGRPANVRPPRPSLADPQFSVLQKLRTDADQPTNVMFERGFPRVVTTSVVVNGKTPVDRARRFVSKYKTLYGQYMADPFERTETAANRLGIEDPDERVRDFYRTLESYQGLPTSSPDLRLELRGTGGPDDEIVAFAQTYKGIDVVGGNLLVVLDGNRVMGSVGALLSDASLDMRPRLDAPAAEEAARAAFGLRTAPALARTELAVFDAGLLPGRSERSSPRLAWRVTLAGPSSVTGLVDADTGALLYGFTEGGEDTDGYDLDLEHANGQNADDTDCYWNTNDDDQIGDEDTLDANDDPDAVAAWNGAWAAYLFFHDTFARHSYDDDDGQLEVYVHAGIEPAFANWKPGAFDCDLIQFSTGNVSYDSLVHEVAHGVMDFTLFGGPDYQGESGALDESHSDVLAAVADGDWLHGDGKSGGGGYHRNLADPPDKGQPDRLSEWVPTGDDNGGVHTGSGIGNKAAYLIAAGGTHPDNGIEVGGLGRPSLGWLEYMAGQLQFPTSGYLDMRGLMMVFADIEYTDWAACQVRNAWAAVEVGNPDLNCDGVEEDPDADGDGVPIAIDNCPTAPNPNQVDTDGDGKGNICDGDADEDGVLDPGFASGLPDNCPGVPNPDQLDANFNGLGAACDPTEDGDLDDDGVADAADNCVLDANPSQTDTDGDGDGNACDPDADRDGISNDDDNCPFTANTDQADADGDGVGDACDGCPQTANEVLAWTTGLPELGIPPHPVEPDGDGDGIPDACDDDVRVAGALLGEGKQLKSDGVAREVSAMGGADTYRKVPLNLSTGNGPQKSFAQFERRALVLDGMDRLVKTWVSDDTGRTVARPHAKTEQERVLRFRPVNGRRYYLFLYFSQPYPSSRTSFTATMTSEPARHREWPQPPPLDR